MKAVGEDNNRRRYRRNLIRLANRYVEPSGGEAFLERAPGPPRETRLIVETEMKRRLRRKNGRLTNTPTVLLGGPNC